jgi:3-methyladenine DNA glycosylase AlkD
MLGLPSLASEIADAIDALPARTTAAIRAVRREYTRRLREAPPRLVVDLARELQRRGQLHRFFGDELIANHAGAGAAAALGRDEVEALGAGMDSWDQVDCFALYIAGPSWRSGQIDDALVQAWAASPDRWWRRAALVATVALNSRARGGNGDTARTLAVCEKLISDRDDMVVKAMSWALRALSATDRAGVTAFLAANQAQLAPRVLREVRTKLETGLKSRR